MKTSKLSPTKTVYQLDNGERYLVDDTKVPYIMESNSGGFAVSLFHNGTWVYMTNCDDAIERIKYIEKEKTKLIMENFHKFSKLQNVRQICSNTVRN